MTEKIYKCCAWCFVCCIFFAVLAGIIYELPVKAESPINIAENKRAIACHTHDNSMLPEYAVDGNEGTRYAGGTACDCGLSWMIVDLGDIYDLKKVHINWEAAHPSKYVLEGSDNGQKYTELAVVTASNNAGWVKTEVSGSCRFLRIREITRVTSAFGFSIWELEVYGEKSEKSDNSVYDYIYADLVKNGSISFSSDGFVKRGTEITLTLTPVPGGNIQQLIYNGKDVTDKMINNEYKFKTDGDAFFSAEFVAPPSARFECEDVPVYATKNSEPGKAVRVEDSFASGGAIAGATGNKYFLFENVVEANCIQIAYCTAFTNNMNLYIRYPWDENFHFAGYINFSTSNSWSMKSSYIAASAAIYIPEGSDIVIRPNTDCSLDYLWLTNDIFSTPDKAPENTLPVSVISENTEDDVMATYGKKLSMVEGDSITFTVPSLYDLYNVLNISYNSENNAKIVFKNGSTVIAEMTLESTALRAYAGIGTRTDEYKAGDKLTLICEKGAIGLDFVTFENAQKPDVIKVTELPKQGERMSVILDGIWEIGAEVFKDWVIPKTVPTNIDFVNSIPVPGLWSSASLDLGAYTSSKSWYKKTVVLDEEPTGQVLLSIGSAQYGRYIYINGQYVDKYEYNYSASVTDITGLLHKGENEIVIMLGSWSQQHNDPNSVGHVLNDGESCKDEPGITDSVELIFNEAPHVSAIQTNPDIDNGTLQVRVTLENNSEADITTDVVISIYELGIFTNGIPDRDEVKVGEYTEKNVNVSANGTAIFTIDAISLSDWMREKCWGPDNPFLYRIEIKTSGDVFSTRFGMRTFDFDPVTKHARLNGELIYLMGTNVTIERYFDDPLCGTTPWNEAWVRKLYTEYKETNWDCFRVCLGQANELWYDLADEMGIMLFDEYPNWGDSDGCTIDTIMPEIYKWIDTRGNHPSIIVFDAQNEALSCTYTDDVCRLGKEYDIQRRPWDNGWREPLDENSPVECHPYCLGGGGVEAIGGDLYSKPVITMADLGFTAEMFPNNPFILNESGEIWLNREGIPMSATASTWEALLPNSTPEEKLTYYAEIMSAQMEAFRAGRAYSGLLFFCGLGSSFPDAKGVTSDILMPDVSSAETLQIRPYTKELFKNAFADLGIVIEQYAETVNRGATMDLPITLINDTGDDVKDLPVTLTIVSADRKTVLYAERFDMSVSAFSADNNGLSTKNISVNVPAYKDYCADGDVVYVYASYELDGETVYSQRKWTINGGSDLSNDKLPTYDWLGSGSSSAGFKGIIKKLASVFALVLLASAAITATVVVKKKKH